MQTKQHASKRNDIVTTGIVTGWQCGVGEREQCPSKTTCDRWHAGEVVGQPIEKYTKKFLQLESTKKHIGRRSIPKHPGDSE